MQMRKVVPLVMVLLMSVVVAGCGGRKGVQEGVDVGQAGADGATATGIEGEGGALGTGIGTGGPDDPLSKRVVYFEYDSDMLTGEGQQVVRAHAQYLAGNPGISVVLEGHADERGTREYNLALGERRAQAVARVLQASGVSGGGIKNVSYGEERPVALGHDESAWSLNRRVEILY
jgi:peptidoglycan-associated lipoprotein